MNSLIGHHAWHKHACRTDRRNVLGLGVFFTTTTGEGEGDFFTTTTGEGDGDFVTTTAGDGEGLLAGVGEGVDGVEGVEGGSPAQGILSISIQPRL